MFARLGSWCHDRRRLVVALWLVALFALGGISSAVGTDFRDDFNLPDVESRTGFDLLDSEFGGQGAGVSGTIVFRADQGVTDPDVQAGMEGLFAELTEEFDTLSIASPYAEGGERQIAPSGELAGQVAFADIELPEGTTFAETTEVSEAIQAGTPDLEGLQVEVGGASFGEFETPESEIIGLAFAIVILILAFGSVLAMGLPIGVALAGISVGTTLLLLLTNVLSVPDFAQFLGIMIGLGVGIDYALFIVTRYRENLHHGHDVRESTSIAIDTAGRAVAFAGITVVISFLGMLVMNVAFVSGLAIAAASVVLVTVVASLTLLPALLGFAGEKVEVTRWRGLIAAGLVALALLGVGLKIDPFLLGLPLAVVVLVAGFAVAPLRREVPRREPKPLTQTTAYRWSRLIQRRPWPAAVLGVVVLGVLAIPTFGLRLGFSDEGNFAEDTTTRQAYDLLAEGFGPGFNGPLLMVAPLADGVDPAAVEGITAAVASDPGVAFVSPAVPNDPTDPTAVLWRIIPTTAPQDEATTDLVNRLRSDVLPPAEEVAGVDAAITGFTAVGVDFSDYLASRLPYFFAAVLILSFLLLMTVFRSLLVPLKAVVMNLLSIGAAYGVVVAVFQWGWFSSVTGVSPAPIEPFMPMMLFAIVFGLSMDYEVFLLSRVREEWHRTGDSHTSVANGLAATARVITAAAAIMVVVFGAFMLESDRVIKLFGLGLSVAILLDATIVRMLLVPATMELLGDKNWWLPRWLDRLLPNIDVEGHGDPLEVDEDGEGEPERELVTV